LATGGGAPLTSPLSPVTPVTLSNDPTDMDMWPLTAAETSLPLPTVLGRGPRAGGGQPLLYVVLLQVPLYLAAMTAAAFTLNKMLVATMRAERENNHQAKHDALTGLSNRTWSRPSTPG
jgi:hypothetical protein